LIDETHDPAGQSWVESAAGHPDFPVQNLPLGVFSVAGGPARIGCAIGDEILDLQGLSKAGLLPAAWRPLLQAETLNALIGNPASVRRGLRRAVFAMLTNPAGERDAAPHLRSSERCEMHLPVQIGDYTDFYVGIHHALNVGRLFRPDAPLLPNYKHVPIGYHGRASTVRPSGLPVTRPDGQMKSPGAEAPEFGPCRRLDYELELGVWIGPGNELGRPIPIAEAGGHIAGFCLLNDWSARDLQTWEYQPLGPFLAKNFHSTVSPWVVTPEALAPFRTFQPARPEGDPRPLPYLWDDHDQAVGGLGVGLEAHLTTQAMRAAGIPPHLLSRGSATHMFWTVAQMVTHHTSGGCNLRPGDLLGTGTISAPDRSGFGSLLEITNGGADPIPLPNGEMRTFLEDGDEIVFTARAATPGRITIGFGACRAMVVPARLVAP